MIARIGHGLGRRGAVPPVTDPGFSDEPAGDDDRIRERDERVDHAGTYLGADMEFLEVAVVPGVRALDHPPPTGLEGLTLLTDHVVSPEHVQQVASLPGVIPGIEMHSDSLGEIEAEPGELLQSGSEQGRAVPVRRRRHATDRDPEGIDHARALRALFPAIDR